MRDHLLENRVRFMSDLKRLELKMHSRIRTRRSKSGNVGSRVIIDPQGHSWSRLKALWTPNRSNPNADMAF
jgi:hypothetical protein